MKKKVVTTSKSSAKRPLRTVLTHPVVRPEKIKGQVMPVNDLAIDIARIVIERRDRISALVKDIFTRTNSYITKIGLKPYDSAATLIRDKVMSDIFEEMQTAIMFHNFETKKLKTPSKNK